MSDLLLKKPLIKFFHGTPMMIVPMKKYFAISLDYSTAACTNLVESDVESSDGSEDKRNDKNDDRSSTQPQTTLCYPTMQILEKNGALWKRFSSTVTGKVTTHNIFTATFGVSRAITSIVSPYDAWKHFIHKNILKIIVKYTNEEAQRRGNTSFLLNLQK